MRGLLFVISAMVVMAMGFWVYKENYDTRAALAEVRVLQARIGQAHSRLGMLRAEWAYLNRPDRLRELAELNFDRLELLPLMPEAFGQIDHIAYPLPDILPIINPVEVSSDAAAAMVTDEDPL